MNNSMTENVFICFASDDFQRVCSIFDSQSAAALDIFQKAETADFPNLLNKTDITVVFIGKHTFEDEKVLYAIEESFNHENAFLAVYLNNTEDVKKSGREILGKNPFELFYFEHKDGETTLNQGAVVLPGMLKRRISSKTSKEMKAKADFVKIYDYIQDNGAENLEKWIEEERQRKTDLWAECAKFSEKEWPDVLKITHKGGIGSFFLYYDWAVRPFSKDNELPDAGSSIIINSNSDSENE